MKTIIVAIDLLKGEEILVHTAVKFGINEQAKIWIIHASAPDPEFVSFNAGPQSVRDQRAETLQEERKLLDKLTSFVKLNGLEATGQLIQGPTAETILKKAETLNANLLIIGHRKHGFLEKMIRGSVGGEIIKHTKIPVLIIPIE